MVGGKGPVVGVSVGWTTVVARVRGGEDVTD